MRKVDVGSAWKRRLSLLGLAASLAAAAAGNWLLAAAGDLDPAFGTGGVVTTDVPSPNCCEVAAAVVTQPDGKIVVAGSVFDTSNNVAADYDFALARYNPDGTLDPTFGAGGIVTTKFYTNSLDRAWSVALQSDGKILAAGVVETGGASYMGVVRYLPNGSLDTTFHSDGKADLEFGIRSSEARAILVQPDGRIVVAGRAWDTVTGDSDFALTRLNPDGSVDLSFNVFGSVRTPFLDGSPTDPYWPPYETVQALAIQPDGKILAAGYATRTTDFYGDMAVVRYTPDGQLDPAFGAAGKVRFNFYGNHADVTGMAVQPDGKILLGGSARNPNGGLRYEMAVARLDTNGVLDPTFDTDGKATTAIQLLDARAKSLALQPDGRIVLAGTVGNDVAVVRYHTTGALDTSFSGDGVATTDLGGLESANGVTLQADGKILVAGSALPLAGGGALAKLLLLRYDGGVAGIEQTIDFASLPDRTFGEPPFTVSATATSGLPVSFAAAGACTVTGSTVTLTASGTCSITASQTGNATYAPAPDVTQSFQVVNGRILTVSLTGTGTGHVGSAPAGIDCGADCSETYADGTVVTLSANPTAGSTFVTWGGDADCLDGVVTLSTNVSCSATFDRTATTTTVTSVLNPSTFAQQVTFNVVVTGANPTGSVTVYDGAVALAPALTLVNGAASLSLSSLSAGTHTITAQYGGDSANAGSTSGALSQIVNQATPSVTLTSSPNPSAPGETVTFSGTVPASATGSVSILDGAFAIGTAPVTAGSFTFATAALGSGSHTVVARYGGDANYLSADSGAVTQVVQTGNRAPQVTAVPNQTVIWGSLLSLPVIASDPDGDPLTFSLVNPPAGAAISAAGQFTWTPASGQVGQAQITVEVSDGTLTSSTSFTVTVGKRATTVSYLGPGAAAPGPVELSARLLDFQNAPIAGRTVAFQLGTQSVSGVTDATGLAAATLLLNQPIGTVSVNASFTGDSAYDPSSATLSFRINAAPIVAPIAPQSIAWGEPLSFFVDASDPDGGSLTFNLLNAPPGVGLIFESATRRRVVWTPTQQQIGSASITIGVSDGVTTTAVAVPVTVLRRATAIVRLGPGASGGGPVSLTATLTDSVLGSPLSGRAVAFALGSQGTAATTDALGVAVGTIDVSQPPQTVPLIASFAGDTLYAPIQASRPFVIFSDLDGDGIRDDWEINGVDIDGNGTIDLNLPAMGANPLRKDIFIEVDWMVKPSACVWLVCWSNGGVLQPQKAALDALILQFASAPVTNPNGSTGITLHVDGGPATIMNPASGQPWGAMSRAGVVPYFASLGTVDAFGNYDWSQFDGLKQAFMEPARRAVFHYVIYADTLAGTAAGGISRGIPAADFAIAAGHPSWNGGLTVTQERSLFMHEAGHNLGLRHGGADDINYKPNYHSVLNYLWSLTGLPPDNRSDYSNVVEPLVDETLAGDVNNDGRIDTLLGYQDWAHLVFSGGGIGDLQALPAPVTTPIDPVDPDELRARGAYARAGDGLLTFRGPSLLVLDSGVQLLSIDVQNISGTDANYVVSASGAPLPAAVDAAVSIAAGAVVRVTLPVDTTGLTPGQYLLTLSLRSSGGELLHQVPAAVAVVDLSVPENQQAASEAIAALAALPSDSGLDASVKSQIVTMLQSIAPSWTVAAHVTGSTAFDAIYRIAEPAIARSPGTISANSLAGAPLFELRLVRAGKVASGTVRMQRPTGEIFEAPVAGNWNESTRVFDGKWLAGKRAGGSIVLAIKQP